jgi:hypothetical protein
VFEIIRKDSVKVLMITQYLVKNDGEKINSHYYQLVLLVAATSLIAIMDMLKTFIHLFTIRGLNKYSTLRSS